MNPLISVIIPVFCASEEQETYLQETLASVAAQTYRDIEVIVIDDASPRNIGSIVTTSGDLPRLKLIKNTSNLRQAGSRNVGVSAASGDFVAFLDHDDIWSANKLERQIEVFQCDPDLGMVFCGIKPFGQCAKAGYTDQSMLPDRPDFEFFMRWGNRVVTASAVMVRKTVLEAVGGFDTRYTTSDDLDLWLKISQKWPIQFIRDVLVSYRIHASNLNKSVDRLNDTRLLFPKYLDFYRKAPFKKKLALTTVIMRKIAGQLYFRVEALLSKPK